MPLQNCTDSGKSGWKWGKGGKCYTGPDGKKKAIQQGNEEKNGKCVPIKDVEVGE